MNTKLLLLVLFEVIMLKCTNGPKPGTETSSTEHPPGQELKEISTFDSAAVAFAKELVYNKEDVDNWLSGNDRFAQYDGKLGWLLYSSIVQDGVDSSKCRYTYDEDGQGSRKMINYANRPCRINTYGNSFTQCHQVSDGETWQEILAAHMGEPLRNFGIGGWSVYQAYLRMLKEEEKTPADFIIFNIYSDDHYRNLDSWRSIRVDRRQYHENGFGEVTLPYLEVNVEKNTITEHPNPCPSPEDVYKLCDLKWVLNRFSNDFAFNLMLSHRVNAARTTDKQYGDLKELTTTYGINTRIDDAKSMNELSHQIHTDAALFSTKKIVELIEEFAATNNKKVLYVLSYNSYEVGKMINEGERFDAEFIDYMEEKGLHFVDLMQKHMLDYQKYKCSTVEYLEQYFIGHYNPRGNFFHAWNIKNDLVKMLEPKPESYN
ncbi:MAG: hypothetical protein ABFS28_07035 [Bacteroidota bacterium]